MTLSGASIMLCQTSREAPISGVSVVRSSVVLELSVVVPDCSVWIGEPREPNRTLSIQTRAIPDCHDGSLAGIDSRKINSPTCPVPSGSMTEGFRGKLLGSLLDFALSLLAIGDLAPAHMTHEHFCYNRRSAATTGLRPAGSPLGPSPYCTSTHRGKLLGSLLDRSLPCQPLATLPKERGPTETVPGRKAETDRVCEGISEGFHPAQSGRVAPKGREPNGRQGSAAFSEDSGKPIGSLLDFALPCQPSMKPAESLL
jgi:hypothetical protein